MKHRVSSSSIFVSVFASASIPFFAGLVVAAAIGCAKVGSEGMDGGGGRGGPRGAGGSRAGLGGHMTCSGLCTDFPTDPIIDPSAPSNAPSMFGGAASGSGPCIMEPEDKTLFPNNWLRPRISFTGASGVVQITISSSLEANPLVAYTSQSHWEIPKSIWVNLSNHVVDKPITVSVRGTTGGASMTTFSVAPVGASGNMVFWAANPAKLDIDIKTCRANPAMCADASQLRGFAVGDESTIPVLTVNQVVQQTRGDNGTASPVTCIGCHGATPDSGFVAFVDSYPWRAATASVQGATAAQASGVAYPSVTQGGLEALLQPGWGPFSFTTSNMANTFWDTGRKIGVASLGLRDPLTSDNSDFPDKNPSPHLAWINLEAPNMHMHMNSDAGDWTYVTYDSAGAGIDSGNAIGFIKHDGDMCGSMPCGAAMPNWSHDGQKIVYSSTNAAVSGRLNREIAQPDPNPNDPTQNAIHQDYDAARTPGLTNLYLVPFNRGMGGTATPIKGAATTAYEEYYAAFSPDDELVAFTRVPAGQEMYANPNAEIMVVQTASTGDAVRLAANNPPSCSGKTSPGVNNHWAKWSPEVQQGSSGKYYWLIFSSNRAGLPPGKSSTGRTIPISQLYLAPVLMPETGVPITYPAIYLWNQPTDLVNTTPAWSTFTIPVIP